MRPIIIAVANQKGGVGKTTTTQNLGVAMKALKPKAKVLIVDLDPQGNLTNGFGLQTEAVNTSVYHILMGNPRPPLEEVVVPLPGGLDFIPSNLLLANAEFELQSMMSRESKLLFALEEADYDYVLIDCPPSLGILTINGLVAAHHVVIPVQAEYYAMMGVKQILGSIAAIRAGRLNKDLNVLGIVITRYDGRKNLSKGVRGHFEETDIPIFKTFIRDNVKVAEAPSYGMSIMEYDDASAGSNDYKKLAKEVLKALTDYQKERGENGR